MLTLTYSCQLILSVVTLVRSSASSVRSTRQPGSKMQSGEAADEEDDTNGLGGGRSSVDSGATVRSYNDEQRAVLESHFQIEKFVKKDTAAELAEKIDGLHGGEQDSCHLRRVDVHCLDFFHFLCLSLSHGLCRVFRVFSFSQRPSV